METINQGSSQKNEKLSALIVENCPTFRKLHALYLKERGFSTMVVDNGKEAVDLYDAGNYFDIIIMSLYMPIMNGTEATKKLREMGANCLIIGASASTDIEDIDNFTKAGLDKFYLKPVSANMLDEMVQSLKKNCIVIEDP